MRRRRFGFGKTSAVVRRAALSCGAVGEQRKLAGREQGVDRCQASGLTAPERCQRQAEYRVRTTAGETLDLCPVCAAITQEQIGDAAPVVTEARNQPGPP
jgi:hypothetical protein